MHTIRFFLRAIVTVVGFEVYAGSTVLPSNVQRCEFLYTEVGWLKLLDYLPAGTRDQMSAGELNPYDANDFVDKLDFKISGPRLKERNHLLSVHQYEIHGGERIEEFLYAWALSIRSLGLDQIRDLAESEDNRDRTIGSKWRTLVTEFILLSVSAASYGLGATGSMIVSEPVIITSLAAAGLAAWSVLQRLKMLFRASNEKAALKTTIQPTVFDQFLDPGIFPLSMLRMADAHSMSIDLGSIADPDSNEERSYFISVSRVDETSTFLTLTQVITRLPKNTLH